MTYRELYSYCVNQLKNANIEDAEFDGRVIFEEATHFNKNGVCLIEWSDIIKDYLPEERLEINFKVINENTRILEIVPYGEKYEELCNSVL